MEKYGDATIVIHHPILFMYESESKKACSIAYKINATIMWRNTYTIDGILVCCVEDGRVCK